MRVIQTIITRHTMLYVYYVFICNHVGRRAIVKEVEVDRGTAAKSVPISDIGTNKNILRVIAQCDIISRVYIIQSHK